MFACRKFIRWMLCVLSSNLLLLIGDRSTNFAKMNAHVFSIGGIGTILNPCTRSHHRCYFQHILHHLNNHLNVNVSRIHLHAVITMHVLLPYALNRKMNHSHNHHTPTDVFVHNNCLINLLLH